MTSQRGTRPCIIVSSVFGLLLAKVHLMIMTVVEVRWSFTKSWATKLFVVTAFMVSRLRTLHKNLDTCSVGICSQVSGDLWIELQPSAAKKTNRCFYRCKKQLIRLSASIRFGKSRIDNLFDQAQWAKKPQL